MFAVAAYSAKDGISRPKIEVVLIATLQAFIFATLTAIYLGGAVEAGH